MTPRWQYALTTFCILATSSIVGLVAYWILYLTPPSWFTWIVAAVAVVLVASLVIDNRRALLDLRKWQWLRLAERIDSEPAPRRSPVPDPHLRTGHVEPNRDEHITRPNAKDDDAIRRA